jgi:hypothetical protein
MIKTNNPTIKSLAHDIYGDLRDQFLIFKNDYTREFVNQYIQTFNHLLQFGRYILQHMYNRRGNYNHVDCLHTPTSIEDSLVQEEWPILQMIDLNNDMFTHTSTNYPHTQFQEMFVIGFILYETSIKLLEILKTTDLYYAIYTDHHLIINHHYPWIKSNDIKCCWQPEGLQQKQFAQDLV